MSKDKNSSTMGEAFFYTQVNTLLKNAEPKQYAILSLDFDNFNFINDLFGFLVGDKILSRIEQLFAEGLRKDEYFTRTHADHFIFLLRLDDDCTIASRFETLTNGGDIAGTILPEHYTFVCSGGIVIVDDPSERLTTLLDKANFSRKKAKGNHCNTFLYYDLNVCEELEWKKKITLSMQSALQNSEFEMHLQPKISFETGRIVGAEALARWNSKANGLIMPYRFIPVFEQNGFVKVLDFFMLYEACRFLKRCEREGHELFPISVNFSKLHIQTQDLAQRIFKVAHDMGVASKYIEIELTESVVSSNFQTLITTITQLKQLGFSVSLDDFGSAYSSLNHLKELPLDTIKIDRAFLNSLSGNSKGVVVLKKMLELASDLHMSTVIEGVETQEQVDLMRGLGCEIAQGFFYAKPMDENRFVSFVQNHLGGNSQPIASTSTRTMQAELHAQQALWDTHNILQELDIGIVKAYLDKESCIQYINDAALTLLGYTRNELRVMHGDNVSNIVCENQRPIILRNALQLLRSHKPQSFVVNVLTKGGVEVTVNGRSTYAQDENGRAMAVYVFRDNTDSTQDNDFLRQNLQEKNAELEIALGIECERNKALQQVQRHSEIVKDLADLISFEWDFATDSFSVSENYEKLMGRKPICRNVSSNQEQLMRFHPDDRARYRHWTQQTYKKKGSNSVEVRLSTVDGRYIWVHCSAKSICDENNIPIKAVGIFSNIDRQKSELALLEQKSHYDTLTHLYNKDELQQRIESELKNHARTNSSLIIFDIDNLNDINNNLGAQFGDTVLREFASEITRLFDHDSITGRIGGDEFAVFVCGEVSSEILCSRANELLDATRKLYSGEHSNYSVSCSAGIALYPKHAKTFKALSQKATTALLDAKAGGKDTCVFYSPGLTNVGYALPTPFVEKESFLDTYFAGDIIYNVFELLYETKDIKISVSKILELMGKALHVDRAYIFEYTQNKRFLSNSFEWCAPNITSQRDNLQNIPSEMYSVFPKGFNEDGLHICYDIQGLDEVSYRVLNSQSIKSVLQCSIRSDGELTGFVGFDDCHSSHEWRGEEIATLGYVARILSVFLRKNRITKELSQSYENYASMIYNLNGHVYVIDRDTYDLLYINHPMQELGIHVGEKCYKAAFGTDFPCENCPSKQLSQTCLKADQDIYSTKINSWVNSAASLLTWTDGSDAVLICCTPIKNRW